MIDVDTSKKQLNESSVDLGDKKISWRPFETINECAHRAFEDSSRKESDDWCPISKLVDDFNMNRQQQIATSVVKVLDELMSDFQP